MDANIILVVTISLGAILISVFSGIWLFIGLGLAAVICSGIFIGDFSTMLYIPFDSTNSFTMTAALTFVFMGNIIVKSGISTMLFRGAAVLLRRLPGCLYHAVIGASAIFAATSGSSTASAATLGRIAVPDLNKRGYAQSLTLGAVCGGSTLASLIPPSVGLIVYGSLTHTSVTKLFMGTVIPGLMIMFMMMIYIMVRVLITPELVPVTNEEVSREGNIKDMLGLLPFFGLMFLILFSLYRGIATPTEAGSVGAICSIIIALCYRRLTWRIIADSLVESVKVTSMLMLLMMVGYLMGNVYGVMKLPKLIAEWVVSMNVSPVVVIIYITIFYTVFGCFMETVPVFVISVGTIYPLIISMGYDGIWFGIFSAIILTAGMITPPVGMCLFVTQSIPPGYTIRQVMKGTIPFLVILYLAAVLLLVWPELVTWLPGKIVG